MKLSGVLFLGLGDSLAAIIGKKYGKNALTLSGKTMEGSLACFFSLGISFYYIIFTRGCNFNIKFPILSYVAIYK